ncbi:adenosine kinase 2 isoform X2 [Rhodnius prolixus]|uniref:adenosine kinase 2 isoform X2 n=1 Tax=Rhodnius prolixus TaxID=13249 RepID=UPI003D18D344
METVLSEGMLFGMGNPLLDISAITDDEFLQKYDLRPNDAILAEAKHMPLYKEIIENYNVEYIAGGSTQNALRVAQWILQKKNVTAFIGSVGKDDYSRILENKAREDGVNVRYQYTAERQTGTCAVLITNNGAYRSLCANLAAAECFVVSHLQEPAVKKLIEHAEFYYSSGFFLTVSIDTILEVAQIALQRNKLFMMNLSAPFLPVFYKEQMMRAMPYVDILFGNETEALAFAKEQNFCTEDLTTIALKMTLLPKQNRLRPRIVILTQGSKLPVLLAKAIKKMNGSGLIVNILKYSSY